MPSVQMGRQVNELVRGYFSGEGSVKTSNKLYASDLKGQVVPAHKKAIDRERDQDNAESYLYQLRCNVAGFTLDEEARYFLDPGLRKEDVLAGNCREMAIVAAHYVHHQMRVPRDRVYFGKITAPGNHSFCLVSDFVIPAHSLNAGLLYPFLKGNPGHLIIDPWLSTACLSSQYIRQTKVKLDEWQAKGKRVAWSGKDGKTPGWHSPAGEYKDAMQRSPLTLVPYS